jgi:magnesium transporter
MADESAEPRGDAGPAGDGPAHGSDPAITREFVESVAAAVAAGDSDRVLALAGDLYLSDTADLIEALDPEFRTPLIRLLGDHFDYAALTDVDTAVRVRLLGELPSGEVAEGLAELDSDDAVYILEDLPEEERERILQLIPIVDRATLRRSLDYPEESAGRRMQTDFIAVPPFWTVGQTIDYLREAADLPEDFYEIFVIDPRFRLRGTVALNRLLRARRPRKIGELMDVEFHPIRATEDQEAVAQLFQRYDLIEAPVVDDADRLVGVLTIDDIVDVIQEEAEEDIKRLAGVGDEEISDSILSISRSRLPWLLVNTITAFVAAAVIGLFDGTIEQMVALAILMPIVASMGGNAGTQAMTVTVRALATRDLGRRNAARVVLREVIVGLVNGLAVALLVGVGAAMWFGNPQLGAVIGSALLFNMLVAGLAGVVIPIALNALRVDPAVASGVFVTTVTDVVGFCAFLGLAAWWFGLF